MLPSQLSSIDEALLVSACNDKWPESQTLEFKQVLPGTDDKSRHEFLKDVCALANASGGDIVYGVQERSGRADVPTPISQAIDPIDATKRRLAQILESGLEPRLNVQMHTVAFSGGGYILIARVPASFQRPHRFKISQHTRWVVRADTHVVDLTYDQIRDSFDRSATLAARARRFRDERIAAIMSGTTGRTMIAGPKCVVHLIPLASIAGRASVDVRSLYNAYQHFIFKKAGAWTRSLNLDGLVVGPAGAGSDVLYTQIFRTGALEGARFGGALAREDDREGDAIPSGVVSGFIRDALVMFLQAVGQWGISGPAIAAVALLDIGGFRLWHQPRGQFTIRQSADRPNLILPEVWIEQLASVTNFDDIARPLLDMLWQAFDVEQCAFYDAHGTWQLF
jgi:Putative DNA-binding domain